MGLEIQECSVYIKDTPIVRDVSFHVNQGEIMALVGHNGAGKSTLMKTIIGSLEKKAGTIRIEEMDQDNNFSSYKKRFSYIPEEPLLLSELTVYQHFQLYEKSYGIDPSKCKERIEAYTKAFEINDKLDEFPESLSKGMRQKVQTICALLPDVSLLLIDEPFMGLDVYAGKYLEELLLQRKCEGLAILLTTHQLDKVKELADRYVMLKNGRVTGSGKTIEFNELDRRDLT